LSIPRGGHITIGPKRLGGTAGAVHGLEVEYYPFIEEEYRVDIDKAIQKVRDLSSQGRSPKLAVFGGSVFIRKAQAPVKEMRDVLNEVGCTIMYDSAHVAGLIAGGQFQDPLREGADIMTASSHKTFFGPQRGFILSWEKHSERIKKAVFPGLVSNHHLHSLAGLAIAATEMLQFGREYAEQVIKNARSLGSRLHELGFDVIGESWGFTESHQVVLDVSKQGDGFEVETKLEKASIVTNRNLLPWDLRSGRHADRPGGLRVGTSEITRMGMKESDMKHIAELMARVILKGEEPSKVEEDVAAFRKDFNKICFAFTSDDPYALYDLVTHE
ncbi:MAG: serine hydroxymethyltransferase, partial [Nitrososphaerales archaeon]